MTVVARMLQDAGLIRYHRGHIEIIDRRGLEARACECYAIIRREIDQDHPIPPTGLDPPEVGTQALVR